MTKDKDININVNVNSEKKEASKPRKEKSSSKTGWVPIGLSALAVIYFFLYGNEPPVKVLTNKMRSTPVEAPWTNYLSEQAGKVKPLMQFALQDMLRRYRQGQQPGQQPPNQPPGFPPGGGGGNQPPPRFPPGGGEGGQQPKQRKKRHPNQKLEQQPSQIFPRSEEIRGNSDESSSGEFNEGRIFSLGMNARQGALKINTQPKEEIKLKIDNDSNVFQSISINRPQEHNIIELEQGEEEEKLSPLFISEEEKPLYEIDLSEITPKDPANFDEGLIEQRSPLFINLSEHELKEDIGEEIIIQSEEEKKIEKKQKEEEKQIIEINNIIFDNKKPSVPIDEEKFRGEMEVADEIRQIHNIQMLANYVKIDNPMEAFIQMILEDYTKCRRKIYTKLRKNILNSLKKGYPLKMIEINFIIATSSRLSNINFNTNMRKLFNMTNVKDQNYRIAQERILDRLRQIFSKVLYMLEKSFTQDIQKLIDLSRVLSEPSDNNVYVDEYCRVHNIIGVDKSELLRKLNLYNKLFYKLVSGYDLEPLEENIYSGLIDEEKNRQLQEIIKSIGKNNIHALYKKYDITENNI